MPTTSHAKAPSASERGPAGRGPSRGRCTSTWNQKGTSAVDRGVLGLQHALLPCSVELRNMCLSAKERIHANTSSRRMQCCQLIALTALRWQRAVGLAGSEAQPCEQISDTSRRFGSDTGLIASRWAFMVAGISFTCETVNAQRAIRAVAGAATANTLAVLTMGYSAQG